MKNRNIPFGYQYQDGVIKLHPIESEVLKQIFMYYLDGKSLNKIADILNAERVEYLPGVISWNRARVMHIIDDKRYLGNDIYPSLIDEETFNFSQERKTDKCNQKKTDRQSEIFKINGFVFCPNCGERMNRRYDSRHKCTVTWSCKNCKTFIGIEDENLISQITEILNRLIRYPELIQKPEIPNMELSLEQRKLENEIARVLDSKEFDKDSLRKMILDNVSLKYNGIPSDAGVVQKLKADFGKSNPLLAFSAGLFDRTVKSVYLNKNKTVEIILLNGQRFEKGKVL